MGRSRGGFTTKIHAVVSERGQLVRYLLTGGEVNDVTQATVLLEGLVGSAVIGDRAYDSDAVVAGIEACGMAAVIPSRSNRKQPRALDRAASATRNVIERYFGRLKAFRRIATRYDKTASSYIALFALGAAMVMLSGWMP